MPSSCRHIFFPYFILNYSLWYGRDKLSHGLLILFTLRPVTPMLRGVPRTMLIADSSETVLRSGIFSFAISSTCAAVSFATLSRLGRALPLSILHAFFDEHGNGRRLQNKGERPILVDGDDNGMMSPAWSAVFALNSLVKPGMLIPCGPSVEPTGGPGVALPAGS